jgi:hypothetical protein
VFYKQFQTNNTKILISLRETKEMLAETYGDINVERHLKTLKETGIFGTAFFNLYYEE